MSEHHNNFYPKLTSTLVCSFPILCLAFGKGYNYPALLLLLLALITSPHWCHSAIFTRPIRLISLAFVSYFATYLLSWMIYGGELSDLDQPSRMLLVLPILYMLIRFPIRHQWLCYALTIGALIAGLVAIIHIQQFGFSRAFTGQNSHWWLKGYMPIQSGNMAMTLGLLSLTISFYALKNRQTPLVVISLVGAFSGVLASFLSGSRGAWIAIPFIFAYLLWANRSLLNKKLIVIMTLIAVGAIGAISSLDRVQNRVAVAVHEIQQYEQDNRYSSLGIRFELWKNALLTFKASPLIGVGEPERYTLQKTHADQGFIDKKVAYEFFSHAHNQYLEDLSIRGVIGLMALLTIFYIPVKLTRANINLKSAEECVYGQLMVVHILSFMLYQLTQAMFSHNSGTIFFALMTIVLFSVTYSLKPLNHINANQN